MSSIKNLIYPLYISINILPQYFLKKMDPQKFIEEKIAEIIGARGGAHGHRG
ncbi:MAG: hypothetical protein ABH950_03865 [Candidatus Altiarchaeota archaeon]